MKKRVLLVVAMVLLFIAPSMVNAGTSPAKPKISKRTITVNAGSTKKLKISPKNAARVWSLKKVTTSNKKILKVSKTKGTKNLAVSLKGKKQFPKTATVKIYLSLKKSAQKKYRNLPKTKILSCKVRVVPAKPQFSHSKLTLKVGETTQLKILPKKQVKSAWTLKKVTTSDQNIGIVPNKKNLSILVQGKQKSSTTVEVVFEMKKKVWKKYKKYSKPRVRTLKCVIDVVNSSANSDEGNNNDDSNDNNSDDENNNNDNDDNNNNDNDNDNDDNDNNNPELKEIDTSGWRFDKTTFVYNGEIQKPKLLEVQDNVTPTYFGDINAINVGKYTLTVKFSVPEGFKEVADMTIEFTIQKAIPSYELPQGLEATYGDTLAEVALPEGFSFQDPLTTSVGNAGRNQFAVTYTPEDTENYEVVTGIYVTIMVKDSSEPEKPELKEIDTSGWRFDKTTFVYNGEIQKPELLGVQDNVTPTYSGDINAINAGKYTLTVKFGVPEGFKEVADMTTEFTIQKAIPSYELPQGLEATYGDTLAEVALPEGFSFQVPLTTSVGNAGSNQFAVTYTPEDTENYEVVTGINIVLTVKKAKVSMMLNDASFEPATNQITADLQGLVDDTTVRYTVNGVTSEEAPMISAPGRYEISAELADTAQNYEGIKKVDANFNFKRRKNWYEISLSPTVVENQLLIDVYLKNVKVKFEADYTMMMLGFNLKYDKSVLEFEEMMQNEEWDVTYNPDRDQSQTDTNDVVAEFFSTDPMQEETRICTMVYNIVDLPKFENVVFTAEELNASTGSIDLPFEYTADGETIVLNPTEDGIKEYTIYMDWDLMKDAAYTLEKTRPQDKEHYQEALQRHISEVFTAE